MAYVKHEDLCGAFKGSCSRWLFFVVCDTSAVLNSFHHYLTLPFSSGDTLLAIRAPIGTQLEVPIPESVSYVCGVCISCTPFIQLLLCLMSQTGYVCVCVIQVLNGQRKYQIRLKSSTGPIEVLLVNKDPSSASPLVLPVPPPDDVLQSLPTPTATPTSQPATAASQVHIDISLLNAANSIYLLISFL